jgi:FkbM family methyltransferase
MTASFNQVLRQILLFPYVMGKAWQHEGWRGGYVALCGTLQAMPFPVTVPRCGKIRLLNEAINVIDNFYLEELRDEAAEQALAAAAAPVVVDVGVNIGVTIRWWLSWNPCARVVGIDMLAEALDFTRARLAEAGTADRFEGVCCAVGEAEGTMEAWIDDPLDGTSSLLSEKGRQCREVAVRTLDDALAAAAPGPIFLLKLDIEGYAGVALRGAAATLARCGRVTIEVHRPEETREAASLLHQAGFELDRFKGRQMWWSRRASS